LIFSLKVLLRLCLTLSECADTLAAESDDDLRECSLISLAKLFSLLEYVARHLYQPPAELIHFFQVRDQISH